MIRKYYAVAAILMSVMLAASCGGSKNTKKAETAIQTETAAAVSETQTLQESETEITEAPETEEEILSETQPAETEAAGVSDDEIRPEFQEAMDEYLEFFEGYCEFMKNYDASDVSSLAKYAELLTQYQETMDALEDINTEELTDAESKLYAETMLKIDQMLIDAM